MRKHKLICLFDTLFWYIIYALPFLSWLLCLWGGGVQNPPDFPTWLDDSLFSDSNFVSDNIRAVFGPSGVFSIATSPMIDCFSWFINCVILHVMVDVLLFIPRLSHNWLEKFTSGRD